VLHRVGDDVSDVLIGQRVHRAAPLAFYPHEPGSSQHAQVLRHQRLAHPESLDELVDKPGLLGQLHDDGQPGWRGEHPQQFARRFECPRLR
jgi:hypothetical protein